MASGLEPQDRNTGSVSSFSAEDHLKAFRDKLDGVPEGGKSRLIPGFLFRNGLDRMFNLSPSQLQDPRNYKVTYLNEDLLAYQVETYRRGLEARDTILKRIKPLEILEMVRDVWGRGNIVQTEVGGYIHYSYLFPEEESTISTTTTQGGNPVGGYWSDTKTTLSRTGKWRAFSTMVDEKIEVHFGNSRFPRPQDIYTSVLDEYFADRHIEGVHYSPPEMLRKTPDSNADYLFIPYFRGIPQTVWRRPDNLGVSVKFPYTKLPNTDGDYTLTPALTHDGILRPNIAGYTWFDQSVSQQEIMDFLSQKLEAQRLAGQLPPQIESVELAKIEELRKRGLFVDPRR